MFYGLFKPDFEGHEKIFDKNNPAWTDDIETNLIFLKQMEQYHNQMFKARGIVLLNDVYESLGFDRCEEVKMLCWFNSDLNRNNYVDFGIHRMGIENKFVLTFPVHGFIDWFI